MHLLKGHKKEIVLFVLLFVSYFILRSIYLLRLPIFTDEAIYMRWAQIALHDSNWRFISLVDGKQPLFVWFAMIFQKFIEDPLLAGRLVSVASGFLTLVGIILLSYELFKNKTISILSGFLYLVYPFAQVYDRMALMDGMVGTFAVWGLLFGVLMVRKIRLDVAYTLGFIIGGAALTKSNGFFSAYLLPFTLLLFDFKQKNAPKRFVKWIILAAFAFAISQALYSILRLSPFFYIIAQKNNVFIYTFQEWIQRPLTYALGNLTVELADLITYTFPVYIVLILAGLFSKKFIKENLLSLAYFIVPFVVFGFFAKIVYPRYLFPMSLPLIPIAGLGFYLLIEKVKKLNKNKYLPLLVSVLILLYPAFRSIQIAYDPVNALFAQADKDQYVASWPAGWGIREANSFLADNSREQKITLYTQGTFGLMPYAIELYQQQNPNLKIVALWPIESDLPAEISKSAQEMPTYTLFYQPCSACSNTFNPPVSWPLSKVMESNLGHLTIYKVLSK